MQKADQTQDQAGRICAAAAPQPFAFSSGPRTARIAIVGEAWGEQEVLFGQPFVGSSGQELTRILGEAGIKRSDCFLTNVFAFQPPGGNIDNLCSSKSEVGKDYPFTQYRQGKYIRPEYFPELVRLGQELDSVRPNVVVALGNTACWALLGSSGIASLRGTVTDSSLVPGLKVLPSYHPSAIMRQWALRPILLVDLMKALRESAFPEIRRPERWLTVAPDLDEIRAWYEAHAVGAKALAVDIETRAGQITCIGFAASRSHALVIPFRVLSSHFGETTYNYWPSDESEVEAWEWVRTLLQLPCPKIFQNGMYDLQYLWKMGLPPRNCLHDTMLLHHSLYPELQKGLGFLGSIYCNEAAWKLLNRKRSDEVEKKDE